MDIETLNTNINSADLDDVIYAFGNGMLLVFRYPNKYNSDYLEMCKSTDLGQTWEYIYISKDWHYSFVGFIDDNSAILHFNYVHGSGHESLRKISSDGSLYEISGWPQYGEPLLYIDGYIFVKRTGRSFDLYKYNDKTLSVSFITKIEDYENLRSWSFLGTEKNEITGQKFVYFVKQGYGEQSYIYQIGIPDNNNDYIIYKRRIMVYDGTFEFPCFFVKKEDYIYFFSKSYSWRILRDSMTNEDLEFLGGYGGWYDSSGHFHPSIIQIQAIIYIPFENHSGLNFYAIVNGGGSLSTLCELTNFERKKNMTYRTIGKVEGTYDTYFFEHLNNGHYIVSGWQRERTFKDYKSPRILAGTTETDCESFSCLNTSGYLPKIIANSNKLSQLFYALTSNITIPSKMVFLNKGKTACYPLAFNINNISFLENVKKEWKEISKNLLFFFDTEERLLLTSDYGETITYDKKLIVYSSNLYYK